MKSVDLAFFPAVSSKPSDIRMGIRFACPNGHRLHVKAYLAGERGICPDCGVRVQIPSGKGSSAPGTKAANSAAVAAAAESVRSIMHQAPPVRGPEHSKRGRPEKPNLSRPNLPPTAGPPGNPPEGASSSDSIVIQTVPPPPPEKSPQINSASSGPVPPEEMPSIDTASAGPHSPESAPSAPATPAWYVRPPGGGQFGPADAQTFSRWMHEKRVVPDSYVWCDGWPDWQRAGDIADQLPGALGRFGGGAKMAADGAMPVVDTSVAKNTMESSAVNALKKTRRRSQRFQFTLAAVLLVAVLALLGVLIHVMTTEPSPKSHPGGVVQNRVAVYETEV